jgi:hypothetical protein
MKQVRRSGLSIGISIECLTLFDELRNVFYLHLPYADIEVEAHSDEIVVWFEGKSSRIIIQTQQGYQIVRLM